ncbi:MAG: ribosome biogenesis GTPase Der [Thermoanaerobaculia bacterium]|nr:ribosome biogenesis GTPase Der [Thermoanaerobaculia bacterium]
MERAAPTPAVAIVGRPNVGKSTLFNRLVRQRRSIVHNQPGVTRDRIVVVADLVPGRPVQWIDTGGLVPGETAGLNEQVLLAVEASDLVLFVVDAAQGLTAADERVLDEIRRRARQIVLVANKGDVRAAREGAGELWSLGLGEPSVVSAEHGGGLGDLVDRVGALLPPADAGAVDDRELVPVAIVGRPNVGKSSLVNRILGEARVLVSPVPGTTRDPVDTLIERDEGRFLMIDTAGIRRRAKVSGTPEDLAVMLARRQIERADVAVLVIEAPQGVTTGDVAVAGAIWEAGRAAVVVVNKWDLLDDAGRERLESSWPRLAQLLADPPRLNLSALTGRGVDKLFERVATARRAWRTEIPTGELNRLFERAVEAHRPPAIEHRPWKLYYATQVATAPPTFMLFANRALAVSHPYRRYLENRLRESLDLPGIPIRLVVRRRSTAEAASA